MWQEGWCWYPFRRCGVSLLGWHTESEGKGTPSRRVGLFFFQAEDGIRDIGVTGVQTCALPISGTLRRKLRKIERLGVRETEVAPDDVPRAVEDLIRLHEAQWAGRRGNPEHLTEQIGRASCRERV